MTHAPELLFLKSCDEVTASKRQRCLFNHLMILSGKCVDKLASVATIKGNQVLAVRLVPLSSLKAKDCGSHVSI